MTPQPGILEPVPRVARYLAFDLISERDPRLALTSLSRRTLGSGAVVGLGPALVTTLGASIEGLHELPHFAGSRVDVPVTPHAVFIWLRGEDRGELIHSGRDIARTLADSFSLAEVVEGFQYRDSRDLSGFEDGTENPVQDAAVAAAIVQGRGPGLDGSSFMAVQRWIHDLDRLEAMAEGEQSLMFGRDKTDNHELDEAPATAHVKRTAQESFVPEAFVVRRSMPWSDGRQQGLMFMAFGKSLYAFEAQLRRMVGAEDGLVDALFRFTRPVTGASYWCPPIWDGGIDLRALTG